MFKRKDGNIVISLSSYNESCCRCYIVLLNVMLIVFGIITIAMGFWIKCNFHRLGVIMDHIVNLPWLAIIYGLVVLTTGIVSHFLLKKTLFLFMYASCLFVLTIFGISLGVITLFISSHAEDLVVKSITFYMENYLTNPKDNTIDNIQMQLECCGNMEPNDWLRTSAGQIPPSCCKIKLCDTCKPSEIYTEGCSSALKRYLLTKTKILSATVLALSFIPLAGCIVGFLFAHIATTGKYQEVE